MTQIPRVLCLTVDRPIQRFTETAAHLDNIGVKWERFDGLDNQICKLSPVECFDLDRAGERIGTKHVAACLSHYLLWKCMSMQPDDSFWVLEYDARLVDGWREKYEEAMSVMPDDWQVIFLGSCCCAGRETKHIGKNVYEVLYPLCGHAIMYRQSALSVLLKEQQRIYAPLDISLYYGAWQKLRVYTIIDPIVVQAGTPLPQ